MKTELKLSAFREIPATEQQEINGGLGPLVAAALKLAVGLAIAAGATIMSDWDNFKNGLKGLPEE